MPNDLDKFLGEVRQESKAAGPEAVAEFEAYLRHFELTRQIYELRAARGWSQLKLAKESGVQQSEISRIEHGRGNPTYQTLAALAGALKMRLSFVPVSEETTGTKRVSKAAPVKVSVSTGSRRIAAPSRKAVAKAARKGSSTARSRASRA